MNMSKINKKGGQRCSYLDAARGHVELEGELRTEGGIGLGILFEDGLEDLELCTGGALAMLDLIGGVGVEGAEVDGGGVVGDGDEGAGIGMGFVAHGWRTGVVVGRKRAKHVIDIKQRKERLVNKPVRVARNNAPHRVRLVRP